jgi:hypothetical protein
LTVPQDNTKWRKSVRSENTACVELHPGGAVRDSKNPDGPRLAVGIGALVFAVKAGRFTR